MCYVCKFKAADGSAVQSQLLREIICRMRPRIPNSSFLVPISLACTALLGISLSGCSSQANFVRPQIAPPAPIAVIPHPAAPTKVTTASWYGPGFNGHPTSTGERYNEHALTAASKTLPIGSHAKVTNLKTGKSVVVRINDHGPYVKGRGIDLSRAAAKKIGIDHHGIAKVAVTRVDTHSDDATSGTPRASEASMAR